MRTIVPLAATTLAALLLASPALAQHAGKHDAASKAKEADEAPDGPAAQAAAVDPSTGKLRALTPEEAAALIEANPGLSHSTEGLIERPLANGAVALDLQERFMDVALARVDPDGTVSSRCVESPAEAKAFLEGKDPKPAAKPQALPTLEEK
ncbi:MAG: hypothetical protein U0229_21620 [Anaeromyxobacter sp.]